MKSLPLFRYFLFLSVVALVFSQIPACAQSVSSDDISVADGLQLPTYGHVWVLDTWKGMKELVRLKPPDGTSDGNFPIKLRRTIEFKSEAASVRVHDTAPTFFVRGVSGGDAGRSDLVIVHVNVEGQKRSVSKDALTQLKQQAKHPADELPELLGVKQQRVGSTDWYRLTPRQVLAAGEYALVPLSSSQGFAEGEVFDFAIDAAAPENAEPIRSEQFRGSE